MVPVKSHDGSKEEEREVEVVFKQITEGVVTILLLTVFQSKTHTAHDAEANASIKQDVLQVERPCHQCFLKKDKREKRGPKFEN